MKKFFDKFRKNNKGFTLVELIIVIAVMAILTVVAAPQYVKYVESSRVEVDKNALGEIAHVAEIEFVNYMVNYSVTDDEIVFTVTDKSGEDATFAAGKSEYSDLVKKIEESFAGYDFKSDKYSTKAITFEIEKSTGKCTWTDPEE